MSTFKNFLLVMASFLFGFLGVYTANIVSAHGGNTNLIHGCVSNQSGNLRIVGANENCKANETPLDWNIQGQAGGISGLEVVSSQGPIVPAGGTRWTQTVTCSSGKIVLGGGGKISLADGTSDGLGNALTNSYPVGNPSTGWTVSMIVADGIPVSLTAYAICVTGPP
jgi:hypothetical protein